MLADTHGNVIHLYERDCSVQRRKQKLIEEAPAPNLDAALREGLCDAALRARPRGRLHQRGHGRVHRRPVGGTFHFLEMNARIQVEHGVTEMLCGVDLVCEQLRVAAGLPLSVAQEDVVARGCAIELRINAEDPEQRFMPSPGEITGWHAPSGPGVRVDAGVETGRKVVPFYDSMVAKVMVWGADREQALARARQGARRARPSRASRPRGTCSARSWTGTSSPRAARRRSHSRRTWGLPHEVRSDVRARPGARDAADVTSSRSPT